MRFVFNPFTGTFDEIAIPIDISSDTNLAVDSPIVLTDDTLSFSFSTDNTWTGDNTFSGEVKGTKESIIMGYNRSLSVTTVDKFIQIADTVLMTDTKGITAIRDGSIVGISVNWNAGLPPFGMTALDLRVKVNGSAVWDNNIGLSNGNDQEEYYTQARGTNTFSAGDTISVCFIGSGTGTIKLNKIIVKLEFYYDD